MSNYLAFKYNEEETLKQLTQYITGTYGEHYNNNNIQALDLIASLGDAEAFCRSNAIKYLSRYGKKNGKSKQDLLKAMHYCVLLYHFSEPVRNGWKEAISKLYENNNLEDKMKNLVKEIKDSKENSRNESPTKKALLNLDPNFVGGVYSSYDGKISTRGSLTDEVNVNYSSKDD